MGIHKVARETGVLNIIPNAGMHAATRALCAPNVFRTSFTNSQPTLALGSVMVQKGHKKAVWITWKYAAGDEAGEGFKQGYLAAGGTIVKELGLPFPMWNSKPCSPKLLLSSLMQSRVFSLVAALPNSSAITPLLGWQEKYRCTDRAF